MSNLAIKEETPRRVVRSAPAAKPRSREVAQARIVREAKKLFRARLAEASVEMTKPAVAATLSVFEKTMLDIVAMLGKTNNEHEALVDIERKSKSRQYARRTPTPRLLLAMANADKIERGRYASIDEMIDSFGETSKK